MVFATYVFPQLALWNTLTVRLQITMTSCITITCTMMVVQAFFQCSKMYMYIQYLCLLAHLSVCLSVHTHCPVSLPALCSRSLQSNHSHPASCSCLAPTASCVAILCVWHCTLITWPDFDRWPHPPSATLHIPQKYATCSITMVITLHVCIDMV